MIHLPVIAAGLCVSIGFLAGPEKEDYEFLQIREEAIKRLDSWNRSRLNASDKLGERAGYEQAGEYEWASVEHRNSNQAQV